MSCTEWWRSLQFVWVALWVVGGHLRQEVVDFAVRHSTTVSIKNCHHTSTFPQDESTPMPCYCYGLKFLCLEYVPKSWNLQSRPDFLSDSWKCRTLARVSAFVSTLIQQNFDADSELFGRSFENPMSVQHSLARNLTSSMLMPRSFNDHINNTQLGLGNSGFRDLLCPPSREMAVVSPSSLSKRF